MLLTASIPRRRRAISFTPLRWRSIPPLPGLSPFPCSPAPPYPLQPLPSPLPVRWLSSARTLDSSSATSSSTSSDTSCRGPSWMLLRAWPEPRLGIQ